MGIISWVDIRQGLLAILIVIIPTVSLSIFLISFLKYYHLSGPDLWELKKNNVPHEVIEPLNELRLKYFFFKFRLMNAIESNIKNSDLYKKYEKEIENQISQIVIPSFEYYFLGILASFYGILFFIYKNFIIKIKSQKSKPFLNRLKKYFIAFY